jgi:hypothetical protein
MNLHDEAKVLKILMAGVICNNHDNGLGFYMIFVGLEFL